MGFPNVALRGGTFYWRKKITVAGTRLMLSLPLRTGNFSSARSIALRLGTAVETLRMAYGQSSGMGSDKLKRVFSDGCAGNCSGYLRIRPGEAHQPAITPPQTPSMLMRGASSLETGQTPSGRSMNLSSSSPVAGNSSTRKRPVTPYSIISPAAWSRGHSCRAILNSSAYPSEARPQGTGGWQSPYPIRSTEILARRGTDHHILGLNN